MGSPPIESFPNDAVRPVVWSFHGLFPNVSFSETPLVEVALRSISQNNTLSEQGLVIKIVIAQVDTAGLRGIAKK